jgi:hypothetical protein
MTELLGRRVRCKLTGFDGIADQYIELLGGTIQYSIQPRGTGGAVPDAYSFDVQQVERSPGLSFDGPAVAPTSPPATDIALGDKVEDIITGVVGIATRKITFLNGCVYFDINEHKNTASKGGDPARLFVQHDRLVVLEKDSIGKTMAARMPAKAPDPAKPKTGGPMTRSARM